MNVQPVAPRPVWQSLMVQPPRRRTVLQLPDDEVRLLLGLRVLRFDRFIAATLAASARHRNVV